MWNANATRIKCYHGDYNLDGYNILKYAVDLPDEDFDSGITSIDFKGLSRNKFLSLRCQNV